MILRRAEAVLRVFLQPVIMIAWRVLFSLRLERTRHIPARGPFIIVMNHQGYLDPVFLQMAVSRPIRYLLTSDFYDIKAVQPFFKLLGTIRVGVGPGATNRAALGLALEVLQAGGVLGIFPEGRLSRDGNFSRLQPGTAYLAAKSGAPVIPAVIDGSYRVLKRGQWPPRRANVTVRFGRPLRFSDPRDRTAEAQILSSWRAS